MSLNEGFNGFSEETLHAARMTILPVTEDPAKGEVLFCAAAMLMASVAGEGEDPLRDALIMTEEFRASVIDFIALMNEAPASEVRFDA